MTNAIKKSLYFGGTVRHAKVKNEYEGYLVPFTDPSERDVYQEWFNDETDYMEHLYPVRGLPLLWEHGFDEGLHMIPIGQFTYAEKRPGFGKGWYTRSTMDFVRHYDAHLKALKKPEDFRRDELEKARLYEEYINDLVSDGIIGFSSGARLASVVVDPDTGHIKRWIMEEGSFTPQPAKPVSTRVEPVRYVDMLRESITIRGAQTTGSATDSPIHLSATNQDEDNLMPEDNNNNSQRMLDEEQRAEVQAMVEQAIADMVPTLVEQLMSESADMTDAERSAAEDAAEEAVRSQLSNLTGAVSDVRSAIRDQQQQIMRSAANAAISAALASRQRTQEAARSAVRDALNGNGQQQGDGNSSEGRGRRNSGGVSSNQGHVSVSEDLKYAHLTASDMALAAALMMQPAKRVNLQNVKLGDVVSEQFLRHLQHKMGKHASSEPYSDSRDNAYLKSVLPFRADEINAATISGQGSNWVMDAWSTDLWEKARTASVYQELQSAGMRVREVPQGSNSITEPTEGADPTAYFVPEANDLAADGRVEVTTTITSFGTGSITVTPGMVKIGVAVTRNLQEDSVINAVQQANQQMMETAEDVIEYLFINGDTETSATTNINLIDGTPSATRPFPVYLTLDGFRKYGLVSYSAYSRTASGGFDLDDIRNTLKLMPLRIRQKRDRIRFIMDGDTEMTTLNLPEAKELALRDANLGIEAGAVTRMYRVPNLVSGELGLTNSAGKINGTSPATNNIYGSMIAVYAPYWVMAWKRRVTLDTDFDIYSGSDILVASMRLGLAPRSGDGAAAITYGIGIS